MELKVDPQKIKELRLNKSWSQEKLADQAAVSLRTIQRMELDGNASLKSRRSVADALGVEPNFLDLELTEQANGLQEQDSGTPEEMKRDFWSNLFAYPGPSNISRKIRTPLLVTLWIGMMITGGPLILVVVAVTFLSVLYPGGSYELFLLASAPLFIIFFIFLGLYHFFKKFSTSSSS